MILVTGSSGLVGSHLLIKLLKKRSKIKALIRDTQSKEKIRKVFQYYTKDSDRLLTQIEWHLGDITDYVSLEEAFDNVDYVYHCAAVISFNSRDRSLMSAVNIQGTSNIVNLCLVKGIKKLVHVSSIAAIAKPVSGNLYTEKSLLPQGKLSAYSFTKSQSELEVWRGVTEGLNAVIINPSIILGPGNWNSGSGKLFSQVFKGMKFFTRGVTGFVDVHDVVRLMMELMESDIHAERYIVSAANLSYEEVFKKIAAGLGAKAPKYYASPFLTSIVWRMDRLLSIVLFRKPLLTRQSAKASHIIQNYTSEKLVNQTGFKFTPLEQTIKQTASFLKEEHNRY